MIQHLDSHLDECIRTCQECHQVCYETAMNHCLEQGGKHTAPAHFRLMLNCAEICQTSANFMLSGSELHGLTCGVCAEVCRRCADACGKMEGMEACAESCRRCAETCKRMAA